MDFRECNRIAFDNYCHREHTFHRYFNQKGYDVMVKQKRKIKQQSRKENPVVICDVPFCKRYIDRVMRDWQKHYIIN